MLSTLLEPTAGRAEVVGYDLLRDAAAIRASIGLTGQYASVDEHLSGHENLVLVGRLLGLSRSAARHRAGELLDRFSLSDVADRRSGSYSGGMRRRLDLAASLVGRPQVVFLDEPTTGLDPRSRLQLWDVVRDLVRDGTTVFLTTQYLEEADELADHIVVIDRGTVVAQGTAAELKKEIGGHVIAVTVTEVGAIRRAQQALALVGADPSADISTQTVTANMADVTAVSAAVRKLDEAGVTIEHLEVHSPSLDDVFLTITGAGADDLDSAGSPNATGSKATAAA
jgi:oleandomycin transport system ATP-binding protein